MAGYKNTLKQNNMYQSMSRKATSTDNSPMENFFGLLNQEMYYGNTFHSYEELEQAIEEYIKYYNNDRIKVKLNGLSPVKYLESIINKDSLNMSYA